METDGIPTFDDVAPIPSDRQLVPRGAAAVQTVHGAAAVAIGTAARVEAEGKMLLARQFPREIGRVEQRLLADCERPSFARTARFARPVGGECAACEGTLFLDDARTKPCGECVDANGKATGKNIARGLSVHFARAAFAAMGNIDVRIMLLHEDDDKSIMRCSATDLETNAHISYDVQVSKIIERRKLRRGQKPLGTRQNSYGDTVYLVRAAEGDHEKDRAAAAAKKLRDAILSLVPQDVKEACEAQVKATNTRALSADRQRTIATMRAAFAGLKVPVSDVELAAYLGHPIDGITDDEYNELQAIYMGLREGAATWLDVVADKRGDFEAAPGADGKAAAPGVVDQLKAKLAEKRDKAKRAPAATDPASGSGAAPSAPAAATTTATGTAAPTGTPPTGAAPAAAATTTATEGGPAAPTTAPSAPTGGTATGTSGPAASAPAPALFDANAPERCDGSGTRVKLTPEAAAAKRTTCPKCGRSMGVRVGQGAQGPEATIPAHVMPPAPAATAAPAEQQPGGAVDSTALRDEPPPPREPGEDDDDDRGAAS